MKTHTLPIIIVTRTTLHVVVLENKKSKRVLAQGDYPWSQESLEATLKKIDNDFEITKVRYLFTKDISYVLKIPLPKGLAKAEKHHFIVESIVDRVPENFENAYWDYQQIDTQDGPVVILFVPVQEIFQQLIVGSRLLGWEIEAVECDELSCTRDKNPLFGIALRTESQVWQIGKGEEVERGREHKKVGSQTFIVIMLVSIIVLSIGGLIFFNKDFSISFLPTQKASSQDASETLSQQSEPIEPQLELKDPTIEIDPTLIPERTKTIEPRELSVEVLSKDASTAVELVELLEKEGVESIVESIDRTKSTPSSTRIKIAHLDYEIIKSFFENILDDRYTLEFEKVSIDGSDYEVTIELGKRN